MAVIKTIKDETLTALGDIIRNKVIGTSEVPVLNVDRRQMRYYSCYGNAFPDYVKKTKIVGRVEYENFYNETLTGVSGLVIAPGTNTSEHPTLIQNSAKRITIKEHFYGEIVTPSDYNYDFEIVVDSNKFSFAPPSSVPTLCEFNLTFTAVGLDENGNEFKYTPLEMVDRINKLETIPNSALHLTDNVSYKFAYNGLNWLIEQCGSKITTENLRNMGFMFDNCDKLEEIPFALNVYSGYLECDVTCMFRNCKKLKTIPMINNLIVYTSSMGNMFSGCSNVRYFPEGFGENWNYNYLHNASYGGLTNLFNGCNSLREAPLVIVKNNYSKATSSYSCCYNSTFNGCYCLDEIRELGVNLGNASSNLFSSTFNNTNRLKNMTFDTNEDGTPKTAPWRNQTVDLTSYVGYASGTYSILSYNSGITADKQVTDDATYQALKNDPDWFSTKLDYSRYNHDSAVNTINSLPDCSATGTNTIKFKGASGALTDGGAINTLTEEEIAVAAAKGWTVTLS